MAFLRDLIAAHALQFERPERAPYDAATGARLLVAFVLVGLVLHPAIRTLVHYSDLAGGPWAGPVLVVTLLIGVAVALKVIVRTSGSTIGLHPWSNWTPRERIYFLTVVPMAAVAFGFVFRAWLAHLAESHGWVQMLLVSVPIGILWGVVQELIYRGLLQTELTRRLGPYAGVLIANLVFTFGPLHFNYFGLEPGSAPQWGMFGAIFGIGLLFGVIYQRSGNLWIPAVLHGLWPPNMT